MKVSRATIPNKNTTTTTILWLCGLCPDNPGEPVPEGTFCHLLWPALVAEWAMPLAAVQAGQGSFPVRAEA